MKKIGSSTWYTRQPNGTYHNRGVIIDWNKTLLTDLHKAETELLKITAGKLKKRYLNISETKKRSLIVPLNYVNLIFSFDLYHLIKDRFDIIIDSKSETPTSINIVYGNIYYEIVIINNVKPST